MAILALWGAVLLTVLVPAIAWALGELTQKGGTAGCVSETGTGGACQDGTALAAASGVALSPDGRSVYVTSPTAHAVAIFDRDPTTGALAQKPGTAGCVSETGSGGGCQDGRALVGATGVAVSPNGESVYVASEVPGGVAIFDRNPITGALTQKPGSAGCVSESVPPPPPQPPPADSCQDGDVSGARGVAVSPDGKSVYTTSDIFGVAVFDRDTATGALDQKDGPNVPGGFGWDIAVSPDGNNVYLTRSLANLVAIFDRAADGALALKAGTAGCVSDSGSGGACQDGTALQVTRDVAVSPDGKSVYVVSSTSFAVAIFDRDPTTGALTQKTGTAGCVAAEHVEAPCQAGTALGQPRGVTVSPDGKSVYVASLLSGAVAIFDRDPTGALAQKAGAASCVSDTGSGGACQDGTALDKVVDVAASPDGNNVYAASFGSDSVAIFDRSTTASPDGDGDGVPDASDNCPSVANPLQQNTDGDAEGDACDADDDNDGVADTADACPLQAAATADGCPAASGGAGGGAAGGGPAGGGGAGAGDAGSGGTGGGGAGGGAGPADTTGPAVPNKASAGLRGDTLTLRLGPFTENVRGTVTVKSGPLAVAATFKKRLRISLGPKPFKAKAGQTAKIKFKLSNKARRAVRGRQRVKLKANVLARDGAGNITKRTLRFTLKVR